MLFGVNMWDVKRVKEHNGVLMPICTFFSDSFAAAIKPGELTWLGNRDFFVCRKGGTELLPLLQQIEPIDHVRNQKPKT